jgi:hypothetical protein
MGGLNLQTGKRWLTIASRSDSQLGGVPDHSNQRIHGASDVPHYQFMRRIADAMNSSRGIEQWHSRPLHDAIRDW